MPIMGRGTDKMFEPRQINWDDEPIYEALLHGPDDMDRHFYAKFNYETLHREAMIISGDHPYEEVRVSQRGHSLSEAIGRLSMTLKDPRERNEPALFHYGMLKPMGHKMPEGTLDSWLMSRNTIYGTMSKGKVRLEMRHSKYITKPFISTEKDTFKEAYNTLNSLSINNWLFE